MTRTSFVLVALLSVLCPNRVWSEPMTAMTTVLARPLGGYGLTPLVFEPSSNFLSLSSNSIETKVRKNERSPVYELIMPNYDDETLPSVSVPNGSGGKTLKKVDYESLVSKDTHVSNKGISSAPSSNSAYYSPGGNMMDLFNNNKNTMVYSEPMPSYKETGPSSYQSRSGKGYSAGQSYSQPLNSAIQSIRSVEVKEVQDSYENSEPQIIDIPPSALPIVINFRTSASQIQINQMHESAEPKEVQQTRSEDEPQFLKHQVTKPVIQEVHEIIMPYRRIVQEIRPVEEEVRTVVARGSRRDKQDPRQAVGGAGLAAAGKYGAQSGSYAAASMPKAKQMKYIKS